MCKGESIFRSGDFDLAGSTYQGTLEKFEVAETRHEELRESFCRHYCCPQDDFDKAPLKGSDIPSAIKGLGMKIYQCFAMILLRPKKFDEVDVWTEDTGVCGCYYRHLNHLPICDIKKQHMFYCRRIALAHTGKTEDAIDCMEEDLAADPGGATVFNRLTKLRRQLGHENLLKEREHKLEVRRKLERKHRRKHAPKEEKSIGCTVRSVYYPVRVCAYDSAAYHA